MFVKDMGNIVGQMVEHIKEDGKMVWCMEKDWWYGQIKDYRKVYGLMDKNNLQKKS